jgi:hypothetical protein
MSFEGYFQLLCANGHYFTADAYYYDTHEDCPCLACGAEVVWENLVDTTNVETEGYVKLTPTGEVDHVDCWYCEATGKLKEHKYTIPKKELDS